MVSKAQLLESDLDQAIVRLERLSFRLRTIGLVIGLLTSVSIIAYLTWSIFFHGLSPIIVVLSTGLSLLLIILHDDLRKRGRVIYSEITDELHWYGDLSKEDIKSEKGVGRLDLAGRIIVSSFVQGSDLPVVSGRLGYIVYALMNLALLAGLYYRYFLR